MHLENGNKFFLAKLAKKGHSGLVLNQDLMIPFASLARGTFFF